MSIFSSINLMNLYRRWTYSENTSIWSANAKRALWRKEQTSDLPRLEMPDFGKQYPIKFDGNGVKIGDTLNIEYLPALVHFNGIESVEDLDSIRIFNGIIKKFEPTIRKDDKNIEFNTEATFVVRNGYSISDFSKQQAITADDLSLWNYFQDNYFYNLANLGEYILLSWASDSYAGANCVIQRENDKLYVLRCHEWQDGIFDNVNYGKVLLPSHLVDKVNSRLLTIELGSWWSGESI